MATTLDLNFVRRLAGHLEPTIADAIKSAMPVAPGADLDDLQHFAAMIATNMAYVVAKKGDESEVQAQVKLLAEISRIHADEIEWATAEKVLGVIFQAAKAAILAGL